MTAIGQDQPLVQSVKQTPDLQLKAGQRVNAIVLGMTRQGISVSIGQEVFQLAASSRFAEARTLILEGVGSPAAAERQVRIVAQNDRPLLSIVVASLAVRPSSEPRAAGAVVQTGQLEVAVEPIDGAGRAIGPSASVRLQVVRSEVEAPSTPGGLPLIRSRTIGETSGMPHGIRGDSGHGTALPGQVPSQPTPEVARRGGPTGAPSVPTTTQEQPKLDKGVVAKLPLTPTASKQSPTVATKQSPTVATGLGVGEPETKGALPQQNQSPKAPAHSHPVDATTSNSSTIPVAASHRAKLAERVAETSNIALPTSSASDRSTGEDPNQPKTAFVIGRTPAGKVVLEADGRLLKIEETVDLPLGTTLQMTPSNSVLAEASWPSPSATETRATLLSRLVELLDDIDRAGRYEASSERQVSERLSPAPNRHLASRLLTLLHAETGMLLEASSRSNGRLSAASEAQRAQIQTMLRELGGTGSEPLADGWKSLSLPMGLDFAEQVTVFFRSQLLDPDDEGSDGKAEHAEIQRAVFDVSFSRLGRYQIDVLCQKGRFDLLIRSESSVSLHDQQEISALFRSACEIAGVGGDIDFKVGDFFEPARLSLDSKDVVT